MNVLNIQAAMMKRAAAIGVKPPSKVFDSKKDCKDAVNRLKKTHVVDLADNALYIQRALSSGKAEKAKEPNKSPKDPKSDKKEKK